MIPALVLALMGCNMQVKFLPQIDAPYVSEVEFLKQVDQNGMELKKVPFESQVVNDSFYLFIKLENLENRGQLRVVFYRRLTHFAPEVMSAVEKLRFRILVDRVLALPLPFYPGPFNRIIRVFQEKDRQDGDFISSYCRGSFYSALQLMVFPRVFILDRLSVDRYEKMMPELAFGFGEDGKYYEYIVFIDKILNPKPGHYRYAIFLNGRLMLDDSLEVHSPSENN